MARINPWLLFGLGAASLAWFATRAKASTPPVSGVLLPHSSTDGQSFTAARFPGVAASGSDSVDPNNLLALGSWLD